MGAMQSNGAPAHGCSVNSPTLPSLANRQPRQIGPPFVTAAIAEPTPRPRWANSKMALLIEIVDYHR